MSQTVRGVIARAKGAPVELETIVVPDPGPGRGGRAGPGLRRLPHRPALPRGRHQRRLPVPARPRGGGRRRVGRRRRHRRRARRLRDPQLARGLRPVPGLPARPALVLLQHAQRDAEDDAGRRHRAVARRSASARSPTRRWSPPASAPRSTRPAKPAVAGLLGCGVMAGLGAAINTGDVGRGDTVAVIGCGGVGDAADRRRAAGRRREDHRRRHRRPQARLGPASSAPPTPSTPAASRRRRGDPGR